MACSGARWNNIAKRCGWIPERAFYRYQLGDIEERVGQMADAMNELSESCLLAPRVAFYRFRLAALYQQLGHARSSLYAHAYRLHHRPL